MKLEAIVIGFCGVLALSACKEVQLNGPVGGAEVSLSPPRSPDAVTWVDASTSKNAVIRERSTVSPQPKVVPRAVCEGDQR
jgi:hypothetical protein